MMNMVEQTAVRLGRTESPNQGPLPPGWEETRKLRIEGAIEKRYVRDAAWEDAKNDYSE